MIALQHRLVRSEIADSQQKDEQQAHGATLSRVAALGQTVCG